MRISLGLRLTRMVAATMLLAAAQAAHAQTFPNRPVRIVVPAALVVIVRRKAARSEEQTVSLLSLLLSRAPPTLLSLA